MLIQIVLLTLAIGKLLLVSFVLIFSRNDVLFCQLLFLSYSTARHSIQFVIAATGLFYLAELVEEYTTTSAKVIKYMIFVSMTV